MSAFYKAICSTVLHLYVCVCMWQYLLYVVCYSVCVATFVCYSVCVATWCNFDHLRVTASWSASWGLASWSTLSVLLAHLLSASGGPRLPCTNTVTQIQIQMQIHIQTHTQLSNENTPSYSKIGNSFLSFWVGCMSHIIWGLVVWTSCEVKNLPQLYHLSDLQCSPVSMASNNVNTFLKSPNNKKLLCFVRRWRYKAKQGNSRIITK